MFVGQFATMKKVLIAW